MGGSAAGGVISGGVMGGVTDGVNWAGNAQQSQTGRKVDVQRKYASRDLSKDGSVYSYDFLISLPDMTVTVLPEISDINGSDGKIVKRDIVDMGIKNARTVGREEGGAILVQNSYTGRELEVGSASIRHGLDGNRLLTNARLGAVIGDVVKNAVPINALKNKGKNAVGTYAMASYATDSSGREFIVVVTVEQRGETVDGIELYDVTHSINGRQKRGSRMGIMPQGVTPNDATSFLDSQVDTKAQGFSPIKTATISISDLLETVKQTHQSILSEDVLAHFGEERNPAGYYTGRAQFSLKDTDSLVSDQMTDALLNDRSFVDYLTRADRINTIAQEPGVRVRFVDGVRGGRANAGI